MKQILFKILILVTFFSFSFEGKSQCSVDQTAVNNYLTARGQSWGFMPDTSDNLPAASLNQLYNETIQIKWASNIQELEPTAPSLNITYFKINNVIGLPPGMNFINASSTVDDVFCDGQGANATICDWAGGAYACLRIEGTPTNYGTYPIQIEVEVGHFGGPSITQFHGFDIVVSQFSTTDTCTSNFMIKNPGVSQYLFYHEDTNNLVSNDSVKWTISGNSGTSYFYHDTVDHWLNDTGTYIVQLDYFNLDSNTHCVSFDTIVVDSVYCAIPFLIRENTCQAYYSPITGKTYSASGTYRDTLFSGFPPGSCMDTVHVLYLNYYPEHDTIYATACDSFAGPSGKVFHSTGIYNDTASGICDTVFQVNLTITPGLIFDYDTVFDTVCLGYMFPSGKFVDSTGTFNDTMPRAGCGDSVLTATIVVKPSKYNNPITDTVWNSYTSGLGNIYTESGAYQEVTENTDTCVIDSLYITIAGYRDTIIDTACGYYFLPSGQIVFSSGNYNDTVTGASFDTVFFIDLFVKELVHVDIYDTVCYSYTSSQGNVYTQTGMYHETYENADTCFSDSLYLIITGLLDTIVDTACGSYQLPSGQIVTVTGIYQDTITGAYCDTITYADIYIKNNKVTLVYDTACQLYLSSQGNIYSQSGVYEEYYKTLDTCYTDSLFLVINVFHDTIIDTVCGSYQLPSGQYAYNTGIYNDTVTGGSCDSVYLLDLIIKPYHYTFTHDTVCGAYVSLLGNTYTVSGNYEEYRETADTCFYDSLFLVITSYHDTIIDTACLTYQLPSGNIVSGTGIYYDTLVGSPCDTVYYVDLFFKPQKYQFIRDTTCQVFISSQGNIYTQTGDYEENYETADTCYTDSLYLVITIPHDTITDTVCGFYQLPSGTYVYTTGIYNDTVTGGSCDSVYLVDLFIKPYWYTFTHDTTCNVYVSSLGNIYTQSGDYEEIRETADTCFYDSLFLVINVGYDTIVDTACHSYLSPSGNVISSSGIYFDTLTSTITGCDSLFRLEITINPISYFSNPVSICPGDSVQIGTSVYYTPGFYDDTLVNIYGCDSIITTNVTYASYTDVFDTITACGSYTSVLGNVYSSSGDYVDTLVTAGCDSIYHTNLTIVQGMAYFFFHQDTAGTITLVDSSTGTDHSYKWTWGDGTMDSAIVAPSHSYATHGTYEVCLELIDTINGCSFVYCDSLTVDSNGVLRSSFTLNVQSYNDFAASIEGFELAEPQIILYPNPANQSVWIESSEVMNEIWIYSSNGKLVQFMNDNSVKTNISVDGYENGIYFVKIKTQYGEINKRLIIQK